MKTFGALAAASLLAAAGWAAPADAQSTGRQFHSAGSVALAPQRPGHYSGPADPGGGPLFGPGWRDDRRWWDRGRRWSGDDWDDKCRRRRWCKRPDRSDYGYAYGSGYGMIGGGEPGFFVQSGDAPEVVNGHARYDYDRGYPYDYYAEPTPRRSAYGRRDSAPRARYCETELTRDRRTGEQVSVRICRN